MESLFYISFIIIVGSLAIIIYFYKKPNHKSSLKDLYYEGLDMLIIGKRKSAYNIFKQIIDVDSNNLRAYFYLGQVLRESGNPKKALTIHKNLLLRNKINQYELLQLYKNISLDYLALDNLEDSILFCRKIIEVNSLNEWAVTQLIKLYKKSNDWTNAIKYLKVFFEVSGSDNNNKLALYNIQLGRSQLKENKFEEARLSFENALELNDSLFIIYFFIGNSYASESDYIYNKANEIEKNNQDSLEKTEDSQKNKIEAIKTLSKAIPMWVHFIENMPEYSWMILPTLKDALQAINKYDDIEKYLIQINKNKPNNVDILAHLADYYANKGEIDKALETINNALDKNEYSLLAQLKSLKIKSLKKNEKELSSQIDRLISSLLKDKRYKKYKQSFLDPNLLWLFKINENIKDEN